MENLLQKHTPDKLLGDVTLREFQEAYDLLRPHYKGDGMWDVATAYYWGIKQGIHNERARRRRATV